MTISAAPSRSAEPGGDGPARDQWTVDFLVVVAISVQLGNRRKLANQFLTDVVLARLRLQRGGTENHNETTHAEQHKSNSSFTTFHIPWPGCLSLS